MTTPTINYSGFLSTALGTNIDLLSGIFNTPIQLICSDSNATYYGNCFTLGNMLIQFTVGFTSTNSSSSNYIMYFPYPYSVTPYVVLLTAYNTTDVNATCNLRSL